MSSPPLAPALLTRLERTEGRVPIAVLDLDLTLIENAPRTRAILADFCRDHEGRHPALGGLAERAWTMPLVFSIEANARALGIPDALLPDALRFWRRTFFDGSYLRHDVALAGAVEAVHALRAHGATIVYLTARVGAMVPGTVESLDRLGFPIGFAGTVLVTKEDPQQGDHAFKAEALPWIGRLGTPFIAADNEPGHVNAMAEVFPASQAVQVATRWSPSAPPLTPHALKVPSLAEAVLRDAATTVSKLTAGGQP